MRISKLALLLVLASPAIRAETLDEALAKAKTAWMKREKKKHARESVVAKYKAEIDSLRAKQKAEVEAATKE